MGRFLQKKFLENSLADLIITEFICHHIFHQKLEKAPAAQRSNPEYNMLRTINDTITEHSEKFRCGCERFDKFVALHESAIASELNAQRSQADCDLRSEHCGSMLHYLSTSAMTSVLHDNGLHLFHILDKQFDKDKEALLELPSTVTPLQMKKIQDQQIKKRLHRVSQQQQIFLLLLQVQTITM